MMALVAGGTLNCGPAGWAGWAAGGWVAWGSATGARRQARPKGTSPPSCAQTLLCSAPTHAFKPKLLQLEAATASCRTSSAANLSTAVKGASSGTENTRNGSLGSEVSTTLKLTLLMAAAGCWLGHEAAANG